MNEPTPKVSVIMPAYNVEAYIEASINSVICQSLREIEIICVNDGSSDKTPEILHTLAQQDNRIIVIDQMNQGQSKARNEGLSLAKGEFIYFFDSDDLLAEDALNVLYHHAKQMDAQLVLFDGTAFFENEALELQFDQKKTLYQRNHEYMGVYKGDELFTAMVNNGDYIVTPCVQFFEHRYLRDHNIQFKEGIIHEDNLFSLQVILLCERACHISNSLYQRRVRENSTVTSEFSVDHYMGHYISLIEMFRFIMMSREKIDDRAIIAAKERLANQYKTTINEYESLPGEQRCQPIFTDPILDFLSGILYTPLPVYVKTVNRQKKEISRGHQEIGSLTRKLTEKQMKLIKTQEKLKEIQDNFRQEREKLKELQERFREEHEKFRTEHEKYKTEHEKFKAEHEKYRAEHEKFIAEHDKYKTEHEKFKAEHEKTVQLREKRVQLNRKLTEAREEIEALKRSKTYLAGTAITFIPRVIKRFYVYCLTREDL